VPSTWDGVIEAVTGLDVPDDFMDPESRRAPERNLLD
jgi:hypothetical protein